MDTTLIVVIVFMAIVCVGGPIIGHYASKASEKHESEKSNKTPQ
ncbi:hypothetical protein [Ruminiclostridium cellobioparum]|uniref:Uncharacterized protein n=1 Tax=Ruminiclostridium cellobioparum subsp. termitidis CT1112 TaxID=1195236 RepID=S0FXX4_RUMCE|nr:hypothetical protein [Ruminiclostridium cellobioparum]EMS73964.1 hypothetical protein CTER_5519 [Ruminiclostridium cellobioparum subsp. termitidis CT1112]